MKTITFKTDDLFFENLSKLAKSLHLSKSELIRKAIQEYEETLKKNMIKEKIKKASFKVRENIKKEIKELENTNLDGLLND